MDWREESILRFLKESGWLRNWAPKEETSTCVLIGLFMQEPSKSSERKYDCFNGVYGFGVSLTSFKSKASPLEERIEIVGFCLSWSYSW